MSITLCQNVTFMHTDFILWLVITWEPIVIVEQDRERHYCLKFNVVSNQNGWLKQEVIKTLMVTYTPQIYKGTFTCLPVAVGQGRRHTSTSPLQPSTSPLYMSSWHINPLLWMTSFPVSVSLKWREILKTLLKQFECRILLAFCQFV